MLSFRKFIETRSAFLASNDDFGLAMHNDMMVDKQDPLEIVVPIMNKVKALFLYCRKLLDKRDKETANLNSGTINAPTSIYLNDIEKISKTAFESLKRYAEFGTSVIKDTVIDRSTKSWTYTSTAFHQYPKNRKADDASYSRFLAKNKDAAERAIESINLVINACEKKNAEIDQKVVSTIDSVTQFLKKSLTYLNNIIEYKDRNFNLTQSIPNLYGAAPTNPHPKSLET